MGEAPIIILIVTFLMQLYNQMYNATLFWTFETN